MRGNRLYVLAPPSSPQTMSFFYLSNAYVQDQDDAVTLLWACSFEHIGFSAVDRLAAGAFVAYWSYHVFGIGTWAILAGVAGFLVVTASGRRVGHPLVRRARALPRCHRR